MTEKIQLGKGELQGGLINLKQQYRVNYLPIVYEDRTVKYGDKIEFAILSPGKDPEKRFYHSLRFVSPEQLRNVILLLIDAYAFFLKKRGLLNANNIRTLPIMISKEIDARFRRIAKQ